MKVLMQNGLHYHRAQYLFHNLSKVASIAMINEIHNLPKALNDFKPDLLMLESKNVDGVVRAYCSDGKKLIEFNQGVDDAPLPDLDVLNFKEDKEKTDISIFVNNNTDTLYVDFLCKNYNVKVYGDLKINSPKYLGKITNVEKFDIINKSKACIVFDPLDVYSVVLLDSCPIAYNKSALKIESFNNFISLMQCIENVNDEKEYQLMKDNIDKIKSIYYANNSLTFTVDTLRQLGFNDMASELEEFYK